MLREGYLRTDVTEAGEIAIQTLQVYAHIYTRKYMDTCINAHTDICTQRCTHRHTRIRTHTYALTHIYIHPYMYSVSLHDNLARYFLVLLPTD